MRLALITVLTSLVVSASAYASETGTYRPGKAYHSVAANAPTDCASHCRGDAQCKSWNFIRPRKSVRSGVCEFNSELATPVPSPISESGTNESVRSSSKFVSSGTNTVRVQSAESVPSSQTYSNSVNSAPATPTPMAMTTPDSPFTPRTYGSTTTAPMVGAPMNAGPMRAGMGSAMASPTGSMAASNRMPEAPVPPQMMQAPNMPLHNMPSNMGVNPQAGQSAMMRLPMPGQAPSALQYAPQMGSPAYPGMYQGMAPRTTMTGGYLSQNALGPQPMMPSPVMRAPMMQPPMTRPMQAAAPNRAIPPSQMPPSQMTGTPPTPMASMRQQLLNHQPLNAQPQQQATIPSGSMNNRPVLPSMMPNPAMAQNPYATRSPYMSPQMMPSRMMPSQGYPYQAMPPQKKGLPLIGNMLSRNRGPQSRGGAYPMGNMPQMGPRPNMPQQMMTPSMATPSGTSYPNAYQMDMARSYAPQMPRSPMNSPATQNPSAFNQMPQIPKQMSPAPKNSLYGSLHDDVRNQAPMMQAPNGAPSGAGSMPIVRSVPSQPVMSSTLGGLAGGPAYPNGL